MTDLSGKTEWVVTAHVWSTFQRECALYCSSWWDR